jgi:probable phosphoglycerate mutase
VGRLLLVRHGESEGNRERVFTPHPEVPLTARGVAQAAATAARIARDYTVAAVVASPYRRAVQTAEAIAHAVERPIGLEPDLRERHWGDLTGRPYADAFREAGYDPVRYWTWRPPGDGGETLDDVRRRAGAVLDRLASAHPAADVVVVSHGGVMTALWFHVTGEWRPGRVVDNAALVVAEHHAGRWRACQLTDSEPTS